MCVDGWMGGLMDGWMDGIRWMDGWMSGWMNWKKLNGLFIDQLIPI